MACTMFSTFGQVRVCSRCSPEHHVDYFLVVSSLFAGAQGIGKTTIAKMACSEIIKARPAHQRSVQLRCMLFHVSMPSLANCAQGVTFLRAPKPGNTEDAKKGFTNSLADALDFSLLDRGA